VVWLRRYALWPALIALNLFLAALLWLFQFTDYSLPGPLADVAFPALVGLLGILTFRAACSLPRRSARLAGRCCSLPAILGGGFHLVAYALAILGIVLVPWATFRLVFNIDEMLNEVRIQRVASPDGSRVADVYYRPTGARGAGGGRVLVRVRQAWPPLLEREVYFVGASGVATEQPTDYVTWVDDDTLYVPETRELLTVGSLRPQPSPLVWVPWNALVHLAWLVKPDLAPPLADVPIYPAQPLDDRVDFHAYPNTWLRSYRLPRQRPEDVAAWYRDQLAQSPWTLVSEKLNRRQTNVPGRQWLRYCFTAEREDHGQRRTYYVQATGFSVNALNTFVNVSTPGPMDAACDDYLNQLPE
jgi:hypothetical protein